MEFSRGSKLLLALAVLGYALFVGWYQSPYASGSDASGYLNSARLMLAGRLTTPIRIPEQLAGDTLPDQNYMPLGFRVVDSGGDRRLVPTYPVGMPLLYAAASFLVGLDHAATLVALLAALAFPGLLYLLAREFGVRSGWSAGISLVSALSPLTLFLALQPMSDLIAATLGIAVVLCALRAERHVGWAVLAGATIALAVLVRPTCLLLFLPVAIALPVRWRSWIGFVLGGLPGAVFLAYYNYTLYGSPVASGYGSVGYLFAARNALPTWAHFALWVPVVATPLVIGAVGLPWLNLSWRRKALLIAWAAPVFLFYSFYQITRETWWYLRFVLPALPPLAIAAGLVWQQLRSAQWLVSIRRQPDEGTAGSSRPEHTVRLAFQPVVFLLLAVIWQIAWSRHFSVSQLELTNRPYPMVARWVAHEMPENAVVAAMEVSGALLYYTDRPFVRPDFFTPERYAKFNARLARQHTQVFAALFPFEEADTLQRQMPGKWEPFARFRYATVWRRVAADDPSATPPAAPAAR